MITHHPIHATGLFLYPLKNEKTPGFVFSGSIESDQWYEMG